MSDLLPNKRIGLARGTHAGLWLTLSSGSRSSASMDSSTQISLALAFAVGVVSLISLSVLALVPVYVAYLGEAAAMMGVAPVSARPPVKLVPQHVFGQALLFAANFGAIFTLLGVSVGLRATDPLTFPPAPSRRPGCRRPRVLMTDLVGPILGRLQLDIRPERCGWSLGALRGAGRAARHWLDVMHRSRAGRDLDHGCLKSERAGRRAAPHRLLGRAGPPVLSGRRRLAQLQPVIRACTAGKVQWRSRPDCSSWSWMS
jgi:hypothetical protein